MYKLTESLKTCEFSQLELHWTDVDLISSDGQTFSCHRFQLAKKSDVFETLFLQKGTTEDVTRRVEIKDITGKTLDTLLGHVYGKK